jgi:hypothetical protein
MSCSGDESEEPPGAARRSYGWITLSPVRCSDLDWRFVHFYSKIKIRSIARLKCPALAWMVGSSVAGLFCCLGGHISVSFVKAGGE